jgi:hypothetical protein
LGKRVKGTESLGERKSTPTQRLGLNTCMQAQKSQLYAFSLSGGGGGGCEDSDVLQRFDVGWLDGIGVASLGLTQAQMCV